MVHFFGPPCMCFAQRFIRQFTRHDNKVAGPCNKIGPAHQMWEDKGDISCFRKEYTSYCWTIVHWICGQLSISWKLRISNSWRRGRHASKAGYIRQHLSFSGFTKYGPAIPSARPPSYICTNPLWSWQQSTQLIHGRERQEFHIRWTFSTVDACAPSHGETTSLMMSWWGGLGWKIYQI